jgi:hypothetical protein
MRTTETPRRGMVFGSLGPFFALVFGLTWGLAALLIVFTDQIEATFGELGYTHPLFILAVYHRASPLCSWSGATMGPRASAATSGA